MNNFLHQIRGLRIWALILKELRHIKADRRLIATLIIPPTVQLVLFGLALNPTVTGLRLGVVDECRQPVSRDLISTFTESMSFKLVGNFASADELGRELSAGRLDAGLIIPSDFARQRDKREGARVQLILDAVNSNNAGIAAGYAQRIIDSFSQRLSEDDPKILLGVEGNRVGSVDLTARVALLYNPGLKSSWFMLTGVLGIFWS
jgi:drug efflux transport system permease protein